VRFTGKVPHNKIPMYFNQMDIVVIPSVLDSESFGVAAVEASACEKPVVVSNVGGLVEVIQDGVNGLVAEPKNALDLAEKIEVLIENVDLRKKLGKEGRKIALEKYDWNKCLENQINAYDFILKNR
jgi:glycosyltransferase involved in cell wall biosynthesis